MVVLHARRASKGEVVYENVHPFWHELNGKTVAFCHNGTVYENLAIDPRFQPSGSTDSEVYFYHLLSQLKFIDLPASFLKSVNAIHDFSSINSIFCQNNEVFLLSKYNLNPLYYTMKMAQQENSTIISSEVLPTLPDDLSWTRLKNGTLLNFHFVRNKWIANWFRA